MRLSCIQRPNAVHASAFSSGYCELRLGTPIGYATPPSCHSAEGNGGDANGEGIARRAGAGAFGSAGAGSASSRYAAASRLKMPEEQSPLDPDAGVAAVAAVATLSPSLARAASM